jgi:predicted nucleic acid-binding protein
MTTPLRCVVDTNLCIKQFITDPLTTKVNQLLDFLAESSTEFFVPDLFYIESANVFWKYVRANLYTLEQAEADLLDLQTLRLQVTSTQSLMAEAVRIGVNYSVTAYDACYVALSDRVKAPLLTLDERLVSSLKDSQFQVHLFTDFDLPPLPNP